MSAQGVLSLKVGAPVILTVNLSSTLVNGSMGIVEECLDAAVRVKFNNGESQLITPFRFTSYDLTQGQKVFVSEQIPLILGYAITIHKVCNLFTTLSYYTK